MNKFEQRAKQAIQAGGVEVLDVVIEKKDSFGGRGKYQTLTFTFHCPCGANQREQLLLQDLWKSRFDRTTNFLRSHIRQHLAEEGLLA